MLQENLVYTPFLETYIRLVKDKTLHEIFTQQKVLLSRFFDSIPEEKYDFAYAEGKWSLKRVIQHITDGERIFTYRLLCIVRGEQQSLPGFDENEYADNDCSESRTPKSVVEELKAVRHATEILVDTLSAAQLSRTGISNGTEISANVIAYIIAGHFAHHIEIIRSRYL